MVVIEPVPCPPHPLNDQARALFRHYYQFLVDTRSCGSHLPKLEDETASLPDAYSQRGGELLLACVEGEPAACIAYRIAGEDVSGRTCEIKRLFVLPAFRGHGLARRLVAEALTRAEARGFTRAILDTDADTMAAALALYRSLGFVEYSPPNGNLSYLELSLARGGK